MKKALYPSILKNKYTNEIVTKIPCFTVVFELEVKDDASAPNQPTDQLLFEEYLGQVQAFGE